MKYLASYLLVPCLIAFIGCATPGKRIKYQYIFQEEISDIKESVAGGSPSQAIQSLSMMLEMDPKNKDTRFLRAIAYQKLNQYERAAEDYNILLEQYPDNGKAHYNLAMIYAFKVVDKKAALKHFDRFLTLDIKSPKAFEVAKIMCALARFQQAAEADANTVFADWSLKMSSEEKNEKAKKNLLLGAIDLDPGRLEPYFAMASELEEKGDLAEAAKYYEKAIDAVPTSAEAHYRLGQLLLKEKDESGAQIHLAKASLFNPNENSPPNIATWAHILKLGISDNSGKGI